MYLFVYQDEHSKLAHFLPQAAVASAVSIDCVKAGELQIWLLELGPKIDKINGRQSNAQLL